MKLIIYDLPDETKIEMKAILDISINGALNEPQNVSLNDNSEVSSSTNCSIVQSSCADIEFLNSEGNPVLDNLFY